MEREEGLQVGLAAFEEIAHEKGQDPGEHEKDDDEHVGERRREIAGELAAEDGEGIAHAIRKSRRLDKSPPPRPRRKPGPTGGRDSEPPMSRAAGAGYR